LRNFENNEIYKRIFEKKLNKKRKSWKIENQLSQTTPYSCVRAQQAARSNVLEMLNRHNHQSIFQKKKDKVTRRQYIKKHKA
jgi:hypothetical protein